jgi:hypothetical protein
MRNITQLSGNGRALVEGLRRHGRKLAHQQAQYDLAQVDADRIKVRRPEPA